MPAGVEIDWVVISLKRTPERLQQFHANNAHQNLTVDTLEAVDGLLLDPQALVRDGLITDDLTWGGGALGAALSHRQCWLRAVETNRPLAIFEDDVFLRSDFASSATHALEGLPENWDIIHFGFNTDSTLEIEIVPGCFVFGHFGRWYPTSVEGQRFVKTSGSVAAVKLITGYGTCAYAVSPRGAQKLLDKCFPLSWTMHPLRAFHAILRGETADAVMNVHYQEMSSFVCVPPIALALNDKATSTIGA